MKVKDVVEGEEENLCNSCANTKCPAGEDGMVWCADYKRYLCRCALCGRFVSPTPGKDGTTYLMMAGLVCKRCQEEK